MAKTVRVKSWEEFKRIAVEKNAKTVTYIIAQSIPAGNYTGLKLIMPVEDTQYIFTDTAKDDKMRRTGIPIHADKNGNKFLTDDTIKSFLRNNLEISNLQIFSYWTA
jgi:hypothetical protein